MNAPQTHQSVEDAIAAFARGELVIVTDDGDREDEGDLLVAASLCTPEKMAFIIRHTSGIVLGAQILKDLGISSIKLLTSGEHRYVGLAGFGIEIVGTELIGP